MAYDIVFPNKNEEVFIRIAEKLGYKGLFFAYSQQEFLQKRELLYHTALTILPMIYCREKKQLQKAKQHSSLIIMQSLGKEDREVIEKYTPDILYDFEASLVQDSLKQHYSGLNNVLCDLLQKKNILVCFSLRHIKVNNEQYLGRVMQNIHLAQKHNVSQVIASFATEPYQMKNPKDLLSFFVVLGMKEDVANQALYNGFLKYCYNQKYRQGKIIAEGIEVVE